MIIGITGGTGCGKTTLLSIIKELGGLVLDCDAIYHDLLLTNEEMLILVEKLADIHAELYGYRQIVTGQDMIDFIEIEFSRIGADTHITPREVIRDFIEVLDIVYQNPSISVRALLGSDSFRFAQNDVAGEQTDACFADFEL